MFEDVGTKIKGIAMAFFIVDIIASVIGGIAIIAADFDMIVLGIGAIALGIFLSWVGALFVYGFGELIETNQRISYKLGGDKVMNFTAPSLGGVPNAVPMQSPYSNPGSDTPGMTPNATQTQPAFTSPSPTAHRWRCDGCGNMIDKEICPFCGKMYGSLARRIETLDRLHKNGTITPAEYEKRVEAIRLERLGGNVDHPTRIYSK